MIIHPQRTLMGCVLFAVIIAMGPSPAWADDLDGIRYGEAALTYAAGSIQEVTPQDGVVNVTTGDNQTVGNRMRLGMNDVFYLKMKNSTEVAVGDLFTVYKRTRKVFHPATGKYLGYLVIRLAVVQVVQVDGELTTARALRAFGSAAPGDPVARFVPPSPPEAAVEPASSDINGMVIELQADIEMTLVAQRNIVYLDRGWEDGLRVGDRLELTRYGGGLPPRQVGEVRVLSTEARSATALVTKSVSRILKGDQFNTKYQADVVPTAPTRSPSMNAPSMNAPSVNAPSGEPSPDKRTVQNAARETRYTLSDLMKQLHYESGDARINPEGYHTLDQLVEVVKAAPPEQLIRVEGHADNMEIGPSLKSQYATNWDLSKARATGVLRYLVEKGGIDSARISSIGYGATKPLISNATEAGRSRNRRVEVVLYSPNAAPSDPELPTAPAQAAADEGYRVSGLGSQGQEPAVSVIKKSVPVDANEAEKPAPTSPVGSDTPHENTEAVPAVPGN
ncbi:MAG TPA: OmpA family protein [Nitrospira sp.]